MSEFQSNFFYISIVISVFFLFWFSTIVKVRNVLIRGFKEHHIEITSWLFWSIASYILIMPLVQRKCGADTAVYYFNYLNERMTGIEIGFEYVISFIRGFTPDPKTGLGIVSALTVGISLVSLIKIRDKINLPLAIFAYCSQLYLYSYNYMRMMFAVSAVMIGYSMIIQQKMKMCIIPFLFATFFHLGCIVVLLTHLVILHFGKYKKLVVFLGLLLLFFFLLFPASFLTLIKIARYDIQISEIERRRLGIGTLIKSLPMLYIFWIYRDKFSKDRTFTWLAMFAIANFLVSFLGYFFGSASRLSNCILVFHIIYGIPWLYARESGRKRRLNLAAFFIVYCCFLYYLASGNFVKMGIVPYY